MTVHSLSNASIEIWNGSINEGGYYFINAVLKDSSNNTLDTKYGIIRVTEEPNITVSAVFLEYDDNITQKVNTNKPFNLTIAIDNVGDYNATNVTATIDLPPGTDTLDNLTKNVNKSTIPGFGSKIVQWNLITNETGNYTVQIQVTSSNAGTYSTAYNISAVQSVVYIENATVKKGKNATVSIVIESDEPIGYGNISLFYNNSVAEVENVQGSWLWSYSKVEIDNENGVVTIWAAFNNSQLPSGTIYFANITLKAIGNPRDMTPLDLEVSELHMVGVPQVRDGIFSIAAISIIYVDDDFNSSTPGWNYDHFDKIQNGIDTAGFGDTVFVFSGIYYENVVVDKTLNLIGENRDNTIIDGGMSGDIIHISANRVNISSFTIQNGILFGIFLNNSNHCIISENIITNNDFGIVLHGSSNNTIFENNLLNHFCGLSTEVSSNNNLIYHNNFNNTFNAVDNCNNIWDNGYPSGGNYWDDYDGIDNYHGSAQDIPGSDGIVDSLYDIPGGSNQDLYPLMHPFTEVVIVSMDDVNVTEWCGGSGYLRGFNGINISYCSLTLSWDPTVVDVTNVDHSDFETIYYSIDHAAGTLSVVATNTMISLTGNFNIAEITFTAVGAVCEWCDLVISESYIGVPHSTMNGKAYINSCVPGDYNGDGTAGNSGDVRYLALHLSGAPGYEHLWWSGGCDCRTIVSMEDVCIPIGVGTGSGYLKAENITEDVGSCQIELSWDPTVFSVIDVHGCDFDSLYYYLDNSLGKLTIIALNTGVGLTGDFCIAEITFEALTCPLCNSIMEIVDSFLLTDDPIPLEIPHTQINGAICCCCHCVDGDMNGDCNLNSADVRYLALYICGDPDYTPLCADGDVNSDGRLNSADVRYLALYICGDPDYIPLYP